MDDQSEKNAEGAQHAVRRVKLGTERMPSVGTPEASFACSVRRHNQQGAAVQNLRYAVQVLEAVYEDETKRLCNEDDDLPEVSPNEVPSETSLKQNKEKPHFRSVANAIRAGIMVERIYRRLSSSSSISVPPNVLLLL
uniref:PDEase_I_N domain-containing protein n=1 Tax=Macrostomum lignano TaxID=282301 RepID=A0A1I8F6G3_9PLAT